MPSAQRTIRVALITVAFAVVAGCSYDSPLTAIECEDEGAIDGNRICQDGIWVERASGDAIIQDAGDDADEDVMPPQDTGDVEPPQDAQDTTTQDVSDTTTEDVTDTAVDDATDATTEDVTDTAVDDATDTAVEDATDTSVEDATDTSDTTTQDTTDTTVDDATDTADPDTGDTGSPCVTPMTVTSNPALGYWPLDAPNSNGAYPHAGSGPFGPAVPSTDAAANPLNVSGQTGNAVEMDGDKDYLKIDHDQQMLIAEGTISFWVNVDSFTGTQGLWSKDANGNPDGGHLTMELQTDQRLHVRLQSDQASYSIQSGVLQPDQWIHVALLFGPTNTGRDGLELYIDGTSVASDPYIGGLSSNIQGEKADNDEPIGLGVTTTTWDATMPGAWPDSTESLSGTLDEVALFDQRLTPQEIQKLAQDSCP